MKGKVKLTGGMYSGRTITTPGGQTHPMGERERLALFNMLGERVQESLVLDAFAGGGTLGLEALSRGALKVVFVEKNHGACGVIRENSDILKCEDRCEIVPTSVESFLSEASIRFDVILADPPYDAFKPETIRELGKIMVDGGVLVVSHPGEPIEINGLSIVKSKQYAGAHIAFYEIADTDN